MTIREHLDTLREDFAMKSDAYIRAEKKLFTEGNGFFDKKLLDDLSEAKTVWQKAANDYHSFLSQIVNHKLNIDAELWCWLIYNVQTVWK